MRARERSQQLAGILGMLCLLAQDTAAERRSLVMGGENGLEWSGGGGTIRAVVPKGSGEVETGNAPGNVIEFNMKDRKGWIFPQRADEEKNITLGILERGGSVTAPTILELGIEDQLAWMIDGDGETAFERKSVPGGAQVNALGVIMDFDLGARFGVNRIRFFPRNAPPDFLAPAFPFQNDFIRGYELFLNDGSEKTQAEGRPVLTTFKLEPQNDEAVVDLRIPPQYVRFIRLKSQTVIGFEIAEFQVFGSGFVPRAEYVSNIFDLGPELALWGKIRWAEEYLGGADLSRVYISTRTGEDDTPLVFNRVDLKSGGEVPWKETAVVTTASGKQLNLDSDLDPKAAIDTFKVLPLAERNRVSLTLEDYLRLDSKKGSVQNDLDSWSQWSPPYSLQGTTGITSAEISDDRLGVPITSPGPRRYFQLKLEFLSDDLEAATGVGPLAFTVSQPPAAAQILGEIFPRQAELGVPATFTYAVMPTKIRLGVDTGLDTYEIVTPVRVEAVEVIEVIYPDGRTESADFSQERLDLLPIFDATGRFGINAVEDRRLQVRFPLITESDVESGRVSLLKIRFRCRVLRYGTKFSGTAWNSSTDNLGQQVIAGNVARLGDADDDLLPVGAATQRGLSVDVPISGAGAALLINSAAIPRPFSPNADGINDVTYIKYDLARLVNAAPIEVEVFDLAGHLVRVLFSGEQGGGSFSIPWNGTDSAGQQVPPGIYLFHIRLDSDARNEEVVGVIEMVY